MNQIRTSFTKFTIAKLFVMFFVFISSIMTAKAEEWRGIIPLKSTRADVERLLGEENNQGRYQFENERAYIHYSTKSCDIADRCDCFVQKDVVTLIYVELEVELKFSKLDTNKQKFVRTVNTKFPNLVTYADFDKGIIYEVDVRDGDLLTIQYLESAKDCKEILKKQKVSKSTFNNFLFHLTSPLSTFLSRVCEPFR